MDKVIAVVQDLLTLNSEQYIFLLAVFSLSVVSFALYLVLVVLRKHERDKS